MESFPKKQENSIEKITLKEKLRQAIKPSLVWGMAVFSLYNISQIKLENKDEENKELYETEESYSFTEKKDDEHNLVISGPLTYNTENYQNSFSPQSFFDKYQVNENILYFDNSNEDFQIFFQNILTHENLLQDVLSSENKESLSKDVFNNYEMIENIIKTKYKEISNTIEEHTNQYKYYDKSIFDNFETFYKYASDDETFKENIIARELLQNYEIEEIAHYKNNPSELKNAKEFYQEKIKYGFEEYIWGEKLKRVELFEKCDFDIRKIQEELEKKAFHEKFKTIQNNISSFNKQKQKRLDIVNSEKYFERLVTELNGDIKAAKKLQNKRIGRIKNSSYRLSNFSWNTLDDASGHSPHYGDVILANEAHSSLIIHEDSHHADENGRNIPITTREKLTRNYSFKKRQNEFEKDFDKEYIKKYGQEYYSNPTEILARKAVFDQELEELGIKKYEEDFTKKHYKIIKQLLDENKLDRNSDEFFRMFEHDALIMIMNTIADTNVDFYKIKSNPDIIINKLINNFENNIQQNKIASSDGKTYYPSEYYSNGNLS